MAIADQDRPRSTGRPWAEVHLDAIRGLAALVVVLGHARGLFFGPVLGSASRVNFDHPGRMPDRAASLISSGMNSGGPRLTVGHEAVMIFFVLSGYLVGGSVVRLMSSGKWSWATYFEKRLVRLWIVLIPAIFVGLLIDDLGRNIFSGNGSIYDFPAGQDYVRLFYYQGARSLKTMIGNIFFLQTIFVPMPGTNIALWSLSNEFWYYILFPFIVKSLFFENNKSIKLVLAGLSASILYLIGGYASYLFLVWLAGVVAALLPPRQFSSTIKHSAIVASAVVVTLVLTLPAINANLHFCEAITGIAAAIMLYCIRSSTSPCSFAIYQIISSFLSRISYTLYAFHLPFSIFCANIFNRPWSLHPISLMYLMKFFLTTALSLIWAYAFYVLFESRTDYVRTLVRAALAKA